MSNIVTRKGPIGDENKKHTDSPVKEMKKKAAANAEKEKQAADKEKVAEKSNANDKHTEKSTQNDKTDKKEKSVDKTVDKDKKEKSTDKNVEKAKPNEKTVDSSKKDKPVEKVAEKQSDKKTDKIEKKEKPTEKAADKKEKIPDKKDTPATPTEKTKDEAKENGKADTPDKQKSTPKSKQNGAKLNGEPVDGTVSSEEEDEMFPELAYEDSDIECFEPPTPEGPSRSYTRRSQVKSSRTPETPRPASEKQADKDYVPEDSRESKLLKLKEDIQSDRKLRSSDSPKRQDKTEKTDSPKPQDKVQEGKDVVTDRIESNDKAESKNDIPEIEVTIEVENEEEARKPDTNYSKSRVKVSPYRRSMRLADQTQTSLLANYTGNNTTMEMDITESSLVLEEPSNAESPYLSGLRSIRGRRSYKPLKEMTLRNIGVNTSIRSTTSTSASETSRPTGTVVGRKRKPEGGDVTEHVEERSKRAKLLERLGGLTKPFRFTSAASDRLCVESTAEIVGINTDLPLTAPVASTDAFDPESMKHSTPLPARPAPPAPAPAAARDKRCAIM